MYKKAAIPMIVILDFLELDTEVSNDSMETIESNKCREILEDDRDANSVLAVIWEKARFSHKNG